MKFIPLYIIFFIVSLSLWGQGLQTDSSYSTQLRFINISSNSSTFQSKDPSYSSFRENFSRSNILRPTSGPIDENFVFASIYSGFKIDFVFKNQLLSEIQFLDLLIASFERGTQRINLFRVNENDSTMIDYRMKNEVFRITLGARKVLTKKNRRFRFFTGIDWKHELHISSLLYEEDRKIFAQKKYSTYVSIPFGVEYRFGKKRDYKKSKALFFSLNYGIGLQNIDPFNRFGSYSGSSLGLSFPL